MQATEALASPIYGDLARLFRLLDLAEPSNIARTDGDPIDLSAFPGVLQVIRTSPLIDLLISHVLPMSQIQAAFELSAARETAKVILKPWE